MSGSENILVSAPGAWGENLAERLGADDVLQVGDGYDALMQMGRRRWPVVVLADQHDLAPLCRASRRLQKDSSLFAICSPEGEPRTRPLVGSILDDYFINPPTRGDLGKIKQAARGERSSRTAGRTKSPPRLSPRDFATLLDSAGAISSLESCVAEIVSRRIGSSAAWVDADKLAAEAPSLLLAAGDVPRVLTAASSPGANDGPGTDLLSAIQDCLPALVANARRTELLHRLAITDHLTEAYNRRYFYHMSDQILRRASHSAARVTMLLYDIDDFKRYNDTYGYSAGDEILRETAGLMKSITRSHDVVARIGGDEFAVLFWDAAGPRKSSSRPLETAYQLADRFRRAVAEHQFPSLGPEASGALTISGGLASFPRDGETSRQLLHKCDKALKEAKRSGKNSIRLVGAE